MVAADDERREQTLRGVRVRRVRLRNAMADLEGALAAPVPGRSGDWWLRVVDCLRDLREALERHARETEAPDGFFAQILADAPRLANSVERLRRDHVEMQAAVEALFGRPKPTDDGEGETSTIREAGLALLGRLARHRHIGADLLYEAYSVDVGPAD